MGFKPASKTQSKARIAIFGPSGSGKTYSALSIGTGLAGEGGIALIDSEFGRASNYSDRFKFDTDKITDPSVDEYIAKIEAAKAEGYPVLIIDSLTHGWHSLLEEVDKKNSNKFQGWAWGSPKQKEFVRAIVGYPGHVIATIRAKTEWAVEANERGKMIPKRIGLAPEQGKGIEYEFDILLEINADHVATVIKDNLTGTLQDKTFTKPGVDLGAAIQKWLTENTPINTPAAADEEDPNAKTKAWAAEQAAKVAKPETPNTPTGQVVDRFLAEGPKDVAGQLENLAKLKAIITERKVTAETQAKWCEANNVDSVDKLPDEYIAKIINKYESLKTKAA